MTLTAPTEQLVEDVAPVYFGALGVSTKRGVEIDDPGERGDTTQCVLRAASRPPATPAQPGPST